MQGYVDMNEKGQDWPLTSVDRLRLIIEIAKNPPVGPQWKDTLKQIAINICQQYEYKNDIQPDHIYEYIKNIEGLTRLIDKYEPKTCNLLPSHPVIPSSFLLNEAQSDSHISTIKEVKKRNDRKREKKEISTAAPIGTDSNSSIAFNSPNSLNLKDEENENIKSNIEKEKQDKGNYSSIMTLSPPLPSAKISEMIIEKDGKRDQVDEDEDYYIHSGEETPRLKAFNYHLKRKSSLTTLSTDNVNLNINTNSNSSIAATSIASITNATLINSSSTIATIGIDNDIDSTNFTSNMESTSHIASSTLSINSPTLQLQDQDDQNSIMTMIAHEANKEFQDQPIGGSTLSKRRISMRRAVIEAKKKKLDKL